MAQRDKIFPKGFIFKRKRDGAPDFVKGTISIKVDEFIEFMNEHISSEGWINIDLLESQDNKYYSALNTWAKGSEDQTQGEVPAPVEPREAQNEPEINVEDIPF